MQKLIYIEEKEGEEKVRKKIRHRNYLSTWYCGCAVYLLWTFFVSREVSKIFFHCVIIIKPSRI